MAASLREYRARIRSTQATKKITRAMELIAASRIIKAQARAAAATPYARELTRAISALATYSRTDHPLTTEPENPQRAGIVIAAYMAGQGTDVEQPESEGVESTAHIDVLHVVFTRFRSMLVQQPDV